MSRTLTDTERRYSQIEREALAAKFTTSRLQMYLLVRKQFQLATDHKPLLPLFNNPQAKLPLRIERHNEDAESRLHYDPHTWKGEHDRLYVKAPVPLPETEKTGVEQHVRAVKRIDHAVILDKIREETENDAKLQQVKKATCNQEYGTRRTQT